MLLIFVFLLEISVGLSLILVKLNRLEKKQSAAPIGRTAVAAGIVVTLFMGGCASDQHVNLGSTSPCTDKEQATSTKIDSEPTYKTCHLMQNNTDPKNERELWMAMGNVFITCPKNVTLSARSGKVNSYPVDACNGKPMAIGEVICGGKLEFSMYTVGGPAVIRLHTTPLYKDVVPVQVLFRDHENSWDKVGTEMEIVLDKHDSEWFTIEPLH